MFSKFPRVLLAPSLIHRNTYKLLNSKHVQKEKQLFFGEQQKTFLLKSKFFLKQMKYSLVQGFKDLKADTKWLQQTYKNKSKDELTGYQISKRKRIITDLLKFIPYSVIIAIPAAELFLPLILWLFPNAIPSFFLFDTHHDQKMDKLEKVQQSSHQILLQKLQDVLRSQGERQDNFLEYDKFRKQFYGIIDHLNQKIDYRTFNSDQLMTVLKFLGGNFYTGTSTINKVVNLFTGTIPRLCYKIYRYIYYKAIDRKPPKYQDPFFVNQNFQIFKFNYFPFQFFKKQFLLWQIDRKFKKLEEEDIAFEKYGLYDIKDHHIKCFARERGLAALTCYITLKNVIKNDWIDVIRHPKFENNNIKLWYSVMLYSFLKKSNKQQN